jgi:23S rRNA U2552 (ribose-2'-O)-methylase RlmE/FtsJ
MSYYKLDTCSTTLSIELFSLIIKDNSYNTPPFIGFSISKCLKDFKSKIEPSTDWDNIKKYTNSFEFIHTNIPNQNISVSKLKPISRAFFKLVEMVNGLNLLEPFKSTDMNCFHLAEGPGGFIEAMTHLRNNKDDKYYGMTLINESNKNIPGWDKIYNVLQKNENIIVDSGGDNTGDMFSLVNFDHCYENYKNSMDLITADGGFDFSIDFNKQEQLASKLILVEMLYTIIMQKKGGSCIIKMYDTFTKISVDIIYFLSSFYKAAYITKPSTSRTANSERYLICENFKLGDTLEYYTFFRSIFDFLTVDSDTTIESILSTEFPYKFLNSLEEINAIIALEQIDNIQNTLKIINNSDKSYDKLNKLKETNIQKCIGWCIKNKVTHNKFNNVSNKFLNSPHKNSFC